jgi:hypothetical protein
MINFLKNYLSTLSIIFAAYLFYNSQNFYQNFLIKTNNLVFIDFSINTLDVFKTIIISYIILLIPFYLLYKENSKARIIYNYIKNKIFLSNYKIKTKEKMAILAWIVKLFFAPLMIVWLT